MTPTLHVLSSNSSGNGYLLQCGEDRLILECGVHTKAIFNILNYDIRCVSALCSHVHSDHAKYIPQYLKYAIPVYSCPDVASRYPNVKPLEPMKRYSIGGFSVLPLKVPHNAECYAFVIDHANIGRLLFVTDAQTFPYSVKGITTMLIEANYSEDLIVDQLCDGYDVRGSSNDHMEIGETINVINRLKSPELNNVILLHLSDANSDEEAFKQRIWRECGVRADAANKGDVFVLSKEDF